MKKQLLIPVSTMVLLFVLNSCQLIPFPLPDGQSIPLKVTDLEGKKLEEAAGGTSIKLESPLFGSLNANGQLIKEGKIVIDSVEVPIKEAKGDVVLFTLPFLFYINPAYVRMGLLYSGSRYELCLECVLYKPTVTGTIFAGRSGDVSDGTFQSPAEITNDGAGNLYLIDQQATAHDRILKVTPAGITTTLGGSADEFGRLVGIAIDESRGRVYVSDATSQQIKFISLTSPSSITILAGSGAAGNDDGTGILASFNFGNDPVPNFSNNEPGQGLAIDASGNLYAGENYSTPHTSQIRRCTPSGVVSTVLGSRIEPMSEGEIVRLGGLTIRNDNTIFFVTGKSTLFQGVVQITSSGSTSRLAGQISHEDLSDGRGVNVQFAYAKAIKYFSDYLYVADGRNGALRRVSLTGEVISLAGTGNEHTQSTLGPGSHLPPIPGSFTMASHASSGDAYYTITRELAGHIRMDVPGGVTVVNRNLIYVTDCGYNCIWKITIR